MSTAPRQIKLGAFLMQTGHHIAAWRHPYAQADAGTNLQHYIALAQRAEAAKFDAVFLADSVGVRTQDTDILARSARAEHFEPLTLLSALAAVTRRIGLIATASTTFNEPYTLARQFASLDLLSDGRAGWNLVTSSSEAEALNFGYEQHVAHADRYARAAEFHDVVTGLWDTWEDGALLRDKASGLYYDLNRLHVLEHRGQHFRVRGPLNVARSPQGRPVVVQAGASEAGRALAARTAEVVFVAHQTLAQAREFYGDVKQRAAAFGRAPDSIKIMPGIFPVIGHTQAEAEDKFARLQALVEPSVGVALLSGMIGADLRGYPIDGPLPELPETNGGKSRQQLLRDLSEGEQLSIRQLALRIAGARGHQQVVGTPRSIADQLQEWFETGAADGFNIMPPWLPGGLDDFIDGVLPELRRRGLFRTEYQGHTLREHLGLAQPVHRHARQESAVAA